MEKLIDKYNNYMIMAENFLEEEKFQKALGALKKAYNYADDFDKINILFEMSDIYLIESDFKNAIDSYEKIIAMDEDQAGAYYGLATVNNMIKGDIDYSIKNFKMAIEKDKDYDRAYYYLGHSYLEIDEYDKALFLFEKCLELNEDDYVALNDISFIYGSKKDFEKFLLYAKKSLEIRPDYFRALYNLGVAYKGLGNNKEALKAYLEAKNYSKFENIYLNMSAIYIEEKNFNLALDILNEGIEFNKNSVNLHYNRACVYARLNDREKAIKDISYANEINENVFSWARNDNDLKDIIKEIENRWL